MCETFFNPLSKVDWRQAKGPKTTQTPEKSRYGLDIFDPGARDNKSRFYRGELLVHGSYLSLNVRREFTQPMAYFLAQIVMCSEDVAPTTQQNLL